MALLAPIIAVTFVATLVRSTFGFGESLVAVPLLALLMPLQIAVPLSVLISILVALIVVVQDRHAIHIESARWLVAFALLGIPLGLWILVAASPRCVKLVLGGIIAVTAPIRCSANASYISSAIIAAGCSSAASCPACWVARTG